MPHLLRLKYKASDYLDLQLVLIGGNRASKVYSDLVEREIYFEKVFKVQKDAISKIMMRIF